MVLDKNAENTISGDVRTRTGFFFFKENGNKNEDLYLISEIDSRNVSET